MKLRRSLPPAAVLVAALAALAAGCGDDPLVRVEGEVRIVPGTVEFPETYVGYPTRRTVTVENTGRAELHLAATVDPPFLLAEVPGRIPGPGHVTLELSFRPATPGEHTGVLFVTVNGGPHEVPLTGVARMPLACPEPPACRVAWFDPDAGRCEVRTAADDTPCAQGCIAAGRCLEGVCRGEGSSCDDGDPCTVDLVLEDCSCLHEPVEERVQTDVCRKEVCVPGVGWTAEDLEDGTACGPVDLCTGDFCRAGQCTRTEAPEDFVCGKGTPCQPPGVCKRNGSTGRMSCVTYAERVLEPLYRVAASSGRDPVFEGVTDGRYVYWAECGSTSCVLRSITPRLDEDGRIEWFDRWGLAARLDGPVHLTGGLMVAGDRLFSTLRAGWLEVFATSNHERLAAVDLAAEGMPLGRGAQAVNAAGDVVLLLADAAGNARQVVAVAPTGGIRWRAPLAGRFRGLVADEHGNVHLGLEPAGGDPLLVSLDAAGQERFRVPAGPREPLAVHDGTLLHGDATLRATVNGELRGALGITVPARFASPLLSGTEGFLIGWPEREDGSTDWAPHLARIDLAAPALDWKRRLDAADPRDLPAEPLLLAGGKVLVGEGGRGCDGGMVLREALGPSQSSWSCKLDAGSYGGPAALVADLWIVADRCARGLAAFRLDVPDPQAPSDPDRVLSRPTPAPFGWVGSRGEPGRTGRPLVR